MKHIGSIFPYAAERERELLHAFRVVMATTKHIIMNQVFSEVVSMPCSRFWVSEERAITVIRTMMAGRYICTTGEKRDMYDEIFARVKELRISHHEAPLQLLVSIVVNSPAPRFYLSASQAKSIINRVRRTT